MVNDDRRTAKSRPRHRRQPRAGPRTDTTPVQRPRRGEHRLSGFAGHGARWSGLYDAAGGRPAFQTLDVPGDASVPAAAAAAVDLVWLAALPAGTEHPLRRPGPTSPAAAL